MNGSKMKEKYFIKYNFIKIHSTYEPAGIKEK